MCKVAERGPHNVRACAATGGCLAEAPVADSCSTEERSDEASCSGREVDVDTQKPILFQASHAKMSYGHDGKLKCVFCMQCMFAFFAQDSEHEVQLKRSRIMQIGHLGSSYMEWVHRPVPGPSRFFDSSILEYLTRTPW